MRLSSKNEQYETILENAFGEYDSAILSGNERDIEEARNKFLDLVGAIWLMMARDDYRKIGRAVNNATDEVTTSLYESNGESYEQYIDELNTTLAGYEKRLRKAYEQEIANDENSDKTINEIAAIVLANEAYQRIRISVTEAHNMRQIVDFDIIDQITNGTGLNVTKTWNTRGDDRVCPICRSMDGVTIPINEPFLVGGENYSTDIGDFKFNYNDRLVASAHPNCRCIITINFE